jgi:hypothetical protein
MKDVIWVHQHVHAAVIWILIESGKSKQKKDADSITKIGLVLPTLEAAEPSKGPLA